MFDERLECELSSVEKNGGVLCPHEEQIKGKGEQKGKKQLEDKKTEAKRILGKSVVDKIYAVK